MGMILRIASSRIVGQGDIVGRSGYFSLNLSANSVMRGRLDARRTLKSLVADLRDITFGYSFPKQMISKLNMSKLRIYTTLKNFFTFSAVDDYDPERGGSNSYPMTKQVVFGINVSF